MRSAEERKIRGSDFETKVSLALVFLDCKGLRTIPVSDYSLLLKVSGSDFKKAVLVSRTVPDLTELG